MIPLRRPRPASQRILGEMAGRTFVRALALCGVACLALGAIACSGEDDAGAAVTATGTARASATPHRTATEPSVGSATASPRPTGEAAVTPSPGISRPPPAGDLTPGPTPSFSTEPLTQADLDARPRGSAGRGAFNIARIIVARVGVDATVATAAVGPNGAMPRPPGNQTPVWYDFSQWPDLGGLPNAGGNVVIAGDAGRFREGLGIFAYLALVRLGDFVRLRLTDGSVACYRVTWNRIVPASMDFFGVVAATSPESVTLITGGSTVDERRIVWGPRASCADEPPLPPTPAPPTGHQKVLMHVEGLRIIVDSGGTVAPDVHTIDFTIQIPPDGMTHWINLYAPNGSAVTDFPQLESPTTMTGAFGRLEGAGTYIVKCAIHAGMSASIVLQ